MAPQAEPRVEAVRGRIDGELAERLVEFWARHRVLEQEQARARLAQVVCVLFGADGDIAGVNSVYEGLAPLINRRFWIYRRFLAPGVEQGVDAELIEATFDQLAQEFTGGADEPVGLCVLAGEREIMERYPEAVWPAAGLLFAGYTDAGAQVRISYFEGARV